MKKKKKGDNSLGSDGIFRSVLAVSGFCLLPPSFTTPVTSSHCFSKQANSSCMHVQKPRLNQEKATTTSSQPPGLLLPDFSLKNARTQHASINMVIILHWLGRWAFLDSQAEGVFARVARIQTSH